MKSIRLFLSARIAILLIYVIVKNPKYSCILFITFYCIHKSLSQALMLQLKEISNLLAHNSELLFYQCYQFRILHILINIHYRRQSFDFRLLILLRFIIWYIILLFVFFCYLVLLLWYNVRRSIMCVIYL